MQEYQLLLFLLIIICHCIFFINQCALFSWHLRARSTSAPFKHVGVCQGCIIESRCRALPYWWAGLSALTHDKVAIITRYGGVFLEQTMKTELVMARNTRLFIFTKVVDCSRIQVTLKCFILPKVCVNTHKFSSGCLLLLFYSWSFTANVLKEKSFSFSFGFPIDRYKISSKLSKFCWVKLTYSDLPKVTSPCPVLVHRGAKKYFIALERFL